MKPRLLLTLLEDAHGGGRRERLCAALREAVRTGQAVLGERPPSTRDLAHDLGLSRVTVEAAYAQLETEGYLHRHVGQGSFVAIDMQRAGAGRARAGRMAPAAGRGGRSRPPPRPPRPPRGPRRGAGAPPRRYLAQSRGVRCHTGQVLVLTSSQQALQLLAATLLDEGDTVWMEDPGYAGARTAFHASGAQVVDMRLDGEGAQLVPAQTPPRLIYLTPSHQFPTGRAMSLQRRLAFIDHAQATGAWLIEDDYDSEFLYDHQPTPALQGLDAHCRVLYIGTFSKSLFPSVRLAYMVLPEPLVKPLVTARTIYDGHPSQPMQAVAADFMDQGHFAAHLRLMRQLYRSRRDALLQALHTHLPWAAPLDSRGGLQMAVRLTEGSEQQQTRRALARGIATPSLSELYHAAPPIAGWRLGFAAIPPEVIESAVRALR